MPIGSIRFILSIMVVFNHLWIVTANQIGAHAVVAFYVISGFLMTKVVNEIYVVPGGLIKYAANRFLRIFPLYWLVLSATLLGLILAPRSFERIYSLTRLPNGALEWLANITLFNLPSAKAVLVPPAWSLTIECFFYIFIGVLFAKSARLTTAWFVVSATYTVYLVASDATFHDRYYPAVAGSLFFSSGALIFFLQHRLRMFAAGQKVRVAIFAFFILFPLLVQWMGGDRLMLGFYGAFVIFFVLFISTVVSGGLQSNALDRLFGNLAYPIFLTHFFVAGCLNVIADNRVRMFSSVHFVISLCLCLGLSYAIVRWFDPKINGTRDRIRVKTAPQRVRPQTV